MISASTFRYLRRFRRLLGAPLAVLGCAVPLTTSADERPLRVAYTHSFACVPLGIAEAQDLWRERGLRVELRGYQTSVEVLSALREAEVDLAFDAIATWVGLAAAGEPIVVIGETNWSHGGDRLLLRQGFGLHELKGKPIGVCLRGNAQALFLREALLREELSLSDFRLVEVPEQEKALQLFTEGRLHAVLTNEPWASRVEAAGAHTIASTADFAGISPEGFAVRKARVDDGTLARFFEGWFGAVAFLRQPANAIRVAELASVYSFAGTENVTAEDVRRYAETLPVHDAVSALQCNDLASGNTRQLIQRLRVLLRLQGRHLDESQLTDLFHLEPIRAAAAAAATRAPAVAVTN